ncbi:Bug family tripartite tricarboxylate transporter substrate binding protein [Neoroseomonas oryzicola]|uniref:Tripartite tricarboxylate transporter substrate binding protein n=1 Tax=Neoroseomonas oryzicola TaxID=535904 RepID=A0A9X9WQD9_9PROT|nr:tripartite tricarboxylate transporter substrate binding protein [Neoroseomonas oryzicola]MBR0662549.1 tripartite tricarboxylate transporter substrate binding protein [Neoroseomonas oryzicola]NKE19292.1 tripartite tricarboxylate transporter substrate binding protein [Neoroseomonas oryzicola]
MNRRLLLAAGLAAPFARAHAQPAGSPNRPIRFVVPFVAGGSTDVAARIIADRMGETLGQPVIVENRGGSGGNIGGDIVAKAPPDGHTILMSVTGLLATNKHIYRQMAFDPDRDLAPVSMAYTADMAIVVTNRLGTRTLAEFVTLAKANPGKFSFGSSGHGASTHTAAELFRQQAGIDMVHVPYRGSGAAMNDLISGNIEMMLVQIAGAAGSIRAGQVTALAATGPRRHPLIPDVPSIAEAGYPQAEATSWGCVMVPAGTPAPAVLRLSQAVREAVVHPPVAQRLEGAGVDGAASTPEELAAFLRAESEKWGRVVRQAGIRVE